MGGFAGQENQARSALAGVLGPEKAAYFFDRWLEHYFTDGDAALLASMGFNCLRIAINYRHFEDDLSPRVLKPDGFRHLDRVVDLCARHGIYSVIDLHALPGGQNIDWHSDNNTNQALCTSPANALTQSGSTATSRTARCGCGSSWPRTTATTPGSRGTTR